MATQDYSYQKIAFAKSFKLTYTHVRTLQSLFPQKRMDAYGDGDWMHTNRFSTALDEK